MIKLPNTENRVKISNFWLEKINEVKDDRTLLEYFVEPFLIACKSISDYILYDFLKSQGFEKDKIRKTLAKRAQIKEFSNFLNLSNEVTDFIKIYLKKIEDFEKDPIITYFVTLRHLIIHGELTHFFIETENGLRFTDESISFLLKSDGGFLLKSDGGRIILNNDDESLFSIYPLIKFSKEEKKNLQDILNETEPIKLMSEYLAKSESLMNEFSEA